MAYVQTCEVEPTLAPLSVEPYIYDNTTNQVLGKW
jgi:hypothetical protein